MHQRSDAPMGAMRGQRRGRWHILTPAIGVTAAATIGVLLVGPGRSEARVGGPGDVLASADGAGAAAPRSLSDTVQVPMMEVEHKYVFSPAMVTIHPGDVIEWTNVSGGPHNVSFWADSIPSAATQLLQGSMPRTTAPLVGPLLTKPDETYSVSFAGAAPGTYRYYCVVHGALGMTGQVVVAP